MAPSDFEATTRHLVRDSAWSSVCGALFGGVVLSGYAIEAGAGPRAVGVLAAIPYAVQSLQLPATIWVDFLRRRKWLCVTLLAAARGIILLLALLPLRPVDSSTLPLLVVGKFAICALSAVAACALNSWLHQLFAGQSLGSFFSRRLFGGTILGCAFTLAVGWLLENRSASHGSAIYAIAFAVAGLAGLASCWHLSRCFEPAMGAAGPAISIRSKLTAPFRHANFRHLLMLLGAWNFASNFAAPFLTLYLVQQLGYGMGNVTRMWVVGQICNALTLYAWGRVSDRLSNKAILSVGLPTFFLCMLGLVLARAGEPLRLQLWILLALHAVLGVVSGGIGLATGNLGLKLAPSGEGTSYLAAVGIVSAAAGGMGPLCAGALGQWLQDSQLALVVRWTSGAVRHELPMLGLAHLEFLFAIAAVIGMYVMHALSRVREGEEVSERRVVQELMLEASRTVDQLSSIGGLLSSLFSFERFSERRLWSRPRPEKQQGSEREAARESSER